MNTFTVLFLCIQACLVQNVFGQCGIGYGAAIAPAAGIAPGLGYGALGLADRAYPAAGYAGLGCGAAGYGAAGYGAAGYAGLGYPAAEIAAYGGAGEGNVAVIGELPVAGTTVVAGQVPIMGAVRFGGDVPAAGAVSISGQCACGCGAEGIYGAGYGAGALYV